MRLKNVSSFKDRHGKTRYRFRKTGYPTVYLKGEPGTPEFLESYQAVLQGRAAPKDPTTRVPPGSLAHLIRLYKQSPGFQALAPATRRNYLGTLAGMEAQFGHCPVRTLGRKHIIQILAGMSDRPAAANNWLKRLRLILDVAIDYEWISTNPARTVKLMKVKSQGFTDWSNEDIAQYLAHWPPGTRQRLAFMLLLFTGQRGSDVVRLGHQHYRNGTLSLTQRKTGTKLDIWVHPALRAEIGRHTKTDMTFILNGYDRPFSTKGFQQWFVKTARAAGLEGRSAHGLRKSAGRILAESGASAHQIMSVLGHKSLAESQKYTAAANQKQLAKAAMNLFENKSFG